MNKSPPSRVRILQIGFAIVGVMVLTKLFSWQIVHGEELSKNARNQQKARTSLQASRGSILGSDDFPIAISSVGWLVWASPQEIENSREAAKKLAPILAPQPQDPGQEATDSAKLAEFIKNYEKQKIELVDKEEERLLDLLDKKGAVWVPLKHKIDNQTKEVIEALGAKGIGFDPEERRNYPEGTMAAHILGFVGSNTAGQDKGYFGLEGKYDIALSGVKGAKDWEKDALGNPVLSGNIRKLSALNGITLKTHINRTIQFLLEKHLKLGLEKYGAKSGAIILMRPQDGAILGMATYPNYDPTKFSQYSQDVFINPNVSQSFEPGSIFKILVMAAALDAKAVKENDACDKCSGPRRIGQYTMATWDNKYYPNSTPGEIIQHSDNVGMIWVAEKVGAERLYTTLRKFGIGSQSGVDLQGETSPTLKDWNKWGQVGLATIGFGQGIAVTPIQMIKAVAGIANKGDVPSPQVVDKLVGEGWEEDIKPSLEEKVISKETAQKVTEMMVNAVRAGEAKWAAPKNYRIAGKTGTAQIPVQGHYDTEKTIASFIGFAPAENPQFVMLLTLKEPSSSPWASETAAPLWFSIAKDLLLQLGIAPEQ